MASTYTATSISVSPVILGTIAEWENTAGVNQFYSSNVITLAKSDGGDVIIHTITVPLIHRAFDVGFQKG